MLYVLRLKTNLDRVDAIHSENIEKARAFYLQRKQMDENTFDKLYVITEGNKK